ncbi:MAG: diaminopimelate epimerase [Candidatus Methanomethylophilaceae archaeon]|nr:diaminopimelate epimerase [Candidatus Methanomethylophilaceae archaeon]
MHFWKYHGIGNDFVLLDGTDGDLEIDNEWCKGACDRHFGIGADGVLYIMPGEGTDITMRIINADGTEAEMCGNGIRCVAVHAYNHGIVDKEEFTINTMAGVLTAKVVVEDGVAVSTVIDMGAPILDGRSIPIDYDGQYINEDFALMKYFFKANAVSMGNPHFITFQEMDDATIDLLGPMIETHRLFPRKTNVEFCKIIDGKIYIRVFERGAGWTLACGTGACASTVAAALNGFVPYDTPVDVHLPGGWLKITVDKDLKYVLMDGPAELVFEGDVPDEYME